MAKISVYLTILISLSLILPCQAQFGLGGTNLFSNTGSLDTSNSSGSNNPANALKNLTTPTFPFPAKEVDTDVNWQAGTFPPFPAQYLSIPDLNTSEREILSQNYFVVVNDNTVKSFAQLYKDNQVQNISNFVTADCIVHPFFAFQNIVRLKVINQSLTPLLESLLIAMVRSTEEDYQTTDDPEVKAEISNNLAFLTVALKLLHPDFPLPRTPDIRQIIQNELNNLNQGKISYSDIFHRNEDFSIYEPIGFYRTTPESRRFYSAFQWLSKMHLDLNDTTNDTKIHNGNEFRRTFLLFQSLVKAKVQPASAGPNQATKAGLTIWEKINKCVTDLNIISTTSTNEQEIYLLPDNMSRIFPPTANGSTVSIESLNDPLRRTRLLLTIRSNALRQLNSTSIFSLEKKEPSSSRERQLKFRLFNPLYAPTDEITFPVPIVEKDASAGFNLTPVALMLMQRHNIRWANRVLAVNTSKLNAQIASLVTASQQTNTAGTENAFWKLFNKFSRGYPEQSPLAFQTENWRTFCLERQSAAWIDNLLAYKEEKKPSIAENKTEQIEKASTAPANNNSVPNSATQPHTIHDIIRRLGISSWRTNNSSNFLEPTIDLYKKISEYETNFENSLNQTGFFPAECLEQSHDFIRLGKRLAIISQSELDGQIPQGEDQALLASIDKLLNVIETPLSGSMFVKFSESGTLEQTVPGVNMGLGYPATLYYILEYKHIYYLLRGASYSYYEHCGAQINEKHWQRQIEFGFLEAPFWCQSFQRTNQHSN